MKSMKTWIAVVLFFAALTSNAAELDEFCVVQDSDGYTNVRAKGSIASKVIARVDHGQVVWIYLGGASKWPNIIFMDDEGKERTGFIHASRLKALSDFESITGEVSEENETEVFKKGDLKVKIELKPFLHEKRELTYQEYENGQRVLIEIDGSEYWGTDGTIPRSEYKKISVQKNGKSVNLPDAALKNLFNPGLYPGNSKVVFNPAEKTIYLTSFNSDGAGGYVVAFVIKEGKFVSRAVLSPF